MCNGTQSQPSARLDLTPYWAFAVFGAFWGAWGASIPRLRDLASVTDGELGIALLFVGAGALPAMLLTGRALDRWGLWLTGPLLLALGLAGCLVALTASGGFAVLCLGMALVGAVSGASDVAMNSLAGRAERATGRPTIATAHATLSAVVVVASLGTGVLGAAGTAFPIPFALVALAAAAACIAIVRAVPTSRQTVDPAHGESGTAAGLPVGLVLGLGVLGALAFAGENAHQSWSAVLLEDELATPVGISAIGPAVFAAVVAVTRFAVARVSSQHARTVIVVGAAVATGGALLLAAAPSLTVALIALALAAAGTAVLFPTILAIVSRAVPEHRRGRTTSLVTTVAYTGFLAGPPYVGLVADAVDLRGAMIAVAALTALLVVLVPVVLRRGAGATEPESEGRESPSSSARS